MKMYAVLQICTIAALFAASGAIISQPLRCSHPDICAPKVITKCPRKDPIAECLTCCCETSRNVEFYNPDRLEPHCTAPPAVFSVKFVGTWTGVCNPDYYVPTAHWSPPTGASHNTKYRMWDACMYNASDGVAQVSQTGATTLIEREYAAAGSNILDTFKSQRIDGAGETTSDLDVDKTHQWVSTVTMLAPSQDRMVGVADLRLCDGHDWKRSVKVCSELFSTASRSERVHNTMQRNSIQWNNCSFGYFIFTFKEYKESNQEIPEDCELDLQGVCPPDRPDGCRTCCCKSSDNAEFYDPDSSVPTECGATENAQYKVSLLPRLKPSCHPDFSVPEDSDYPYFSGLLVTAHRAVKLLDKCQITSSNVLVYILNQETIVAGIRALLEREVEEGIIYDAFVARNVLGKARGRRSGHIEVSPESSHVTILSKLIPTANQFVGLSGLQLCGAEGWKDRVEVCVELLAAVNRSLTPDTESHIQGNNCSFGRVVLQRKLKDLVPPLPPSTCKPVNESVYMIPDLDLAACCAYEFIIEGQVMRVHRRHGDTRYSHLLVVRVTAVHYDDIGHIEVGKVVEIKVCSLPLRIKFKRTYRLTGTRECGSGELEISEMGILGNIPELGRGGPVGEGPCAPYILAGNCDDPR